MRLSIPLVLLPLGSAPVWANTISVNTISEMPKDLTITIFEFGGPTGFFNDWQQLLSDNSIGWGTWDGSSFNQSDQFGGEYYFSSNTERAVAPYGLKMLGGPSYQFVFANPVYAVGATFLSMQDANFHVGAQTVSAYDAAGTLLGISQPGSLTEANGPFELHQDVAGRDFASSWAGIWSDTALSTVIFSGYRTDGTGPASNFASFAFSAIRYSEGPPPSGTRPRTLQRPASDDRNCPSAADASRVEMY